MLAIGTVSEYGALIFCDIIRCKPGWEARPGYEGDRRLLQEVRNVERRVARDDLMR